MRPDVQSPVRERVMVPTVVGTLAVFQRGSGQQSIVLWPSIFTDHRIYDGLVARLSDQFRFLLIDGPGHGASGGLTRNGTGAANGQAMIEVMDAFGIGQAIVGGTSWGGLVAAEAALGRPERVSALLLMNTPMLIDSRAPGLKARAIAAGARWMLGSKLFRDGVARSFFKPATIDSKPEYMATFHAMLKNASPRDLAEAVRSVILEGEPLMDRLPNIAVPTLVLAGKHDSMYPLDVQVEASLRLPNGFFEAVDSNHISVVDAPEAVADAVLTFIDGTIAA